MKISTALSSASEILKEADVAEFRKEAASLLAFVLNKNTAFLVAYPEFELSEGESSTFKEYVARRARHEPFQYIVGHQEFYGLDFVVSPDVLIPRPETEILVECAINILSGLEKPRFCEVGVGSGCIAVSILHTVRSAKAVCVDISEAALAVAGANAEKHKVDSRLELRHADVFNGLDQRFDLIVSNPPYVPDDQLDSLQAEVRDFEPQVALRGGKNGLAIVERIIREAPRFLKSDGVLLLEIGFDQALKIGEFIDPRIWADPVLLPDLQGIPRVVQVIKTAG